MAQTCFVQRHRGRSNIGTFDENRTSLSKDSLQADHQPEHSILQSSNKTRLALYLAVKKPKTDDQSSIMSNSSRDVSRSDINTVSPHSRQPSSISSMSAHSASTSRTMYTIESTVADAHAANKPTSRQFSTQAPGPATSTSSFARESWSSSSAQSQHPEPSYPINSHSSQDELRRLKSPLANLIKHVNGLQPLAIDVPLQSSDGDGYEDQAQHRQAGRQKRPPASFKHNEPLKDAAGSERTLRQRDSTISLPPKAALHPCNSRSAAGSPPKSTQRRTSSIQKAKEVAVALANGIIEGSGKVRHKMSQSIDKTFSHFPRRQTQTRPTEHRFQTETEPLAARDGPDATDLNSMRKELPPAAEVYGKPAYFTECEHVSPPTTLPLNQPVRSVRLTRNLLARPSYEHRMHLKTMARHPELKAPKIDVISGPCATCDLKLHRSRETDVLRSWNKKYDKLAKRLADRRLAYMNEWGSGISKDALRAAGREIPIKALEAKIVELHIARELAVCHVWMDWKAKWGVSPVEVMPVREKGEYEGTALSPVKSPKYVTEDQVRCGLTGAGYMRTGKHGTAVDDVRDPGRMRLSWSEKSQLPKVPRGYKEGQGLKWTEEEKKLLEKETWER